MFPTDSNSLFFLLLGKDNAWLPWIVLVFFLLQKGPAIMTWLEDHATFQKAEYTLSGCFYIDKKHGHCHATLPSETEAFLHFLQISKVTATLKKGITLFTGCCIQTSDDTESITIPASGQGIWVQPTLFARFKINTEQTQFRKQDQEDDTTNTTMLEECKLTIVLQTKTGSFQDIRDFLQSCLTSYKKFKAAKANKLFVVKPSFDNRSLESESSRYIDFKSNKTFDNLFFKGKAELLTRLDQFRCVAGDCVAAKLGLPSTLGLLFYGEPGTGKTSAIKAIANYMQKHLIVVPMNKIKTRRDLERLFYSSEVCWLPFDKRIYVFEEIDCNGWDDVVIDRKLRDVCKKSDKDSDSEEVVVLEELKELKDSLRSPLHKSRRRKEEEEKADKLTLGAILEILDGVVECPGRMVIMTTNRRDYLDPALTRPGRIDVEIEFGRLGRKEIGEICRKLWCCDGSAEIDEELLQQVPEGKWTQAELAQRLYMHQDPNKFLQSLIDESD
jgi:hypothetical protein